MYIYLCFLLGLDKKVVGVVPVGQQVRGLLIIHTHVEIREHAGEEVVNFSGDIQDVSHPGTRTTRPRFSLCVTLNTLQRPNTVPKTTLPTTLRVRISEGH